ncbi:MAG: zf-HC2 domain-containing protein [Butyrivibrio sp.]|nr:zf-HC2 domain-containing protein [Butyrivibrio sp.]
MNKFECDLIADLLPIYMDKKCCDDTRKFVEDHIKSCDECREMYDAMAREIPTVESSQKKKKLRLSPVSKMALVVLAYWAFVVVALIIYAYIMINGVML